MNITKEKFFNNFPYEHMRKEQEYILNKIYDNYDKYKYFVIEAPTGTGKSAIAKTLMNINKKNILLTSTKYLQNQYETEFKDFLSIKGQSNYCCDLDNNVTCDKAVCKINTSIRKTCNNCSYYNKLENVDNAKFIITSYSSFLTNPYLKNVSYSSFKNKLEKYDLMVLDECHLLENNLISDVGFVINIKKLNEKYNILKDIDFKDLIILTAPLKSGFHHNEKLLKILQGVLLNKINYYTKFIKDYQYDIKNLNANELIYVQSAISSRETLEKLLKKIDKFLSNKNKNNWVVEPSNDNLYIQPINIESYFLNRINNYANKFVFLSASILDLDGYIHDLGINSNEALKIKIPSTFDYHRSPIISFPSGKMNYQNIDNSLPKIIDNIKFILDQHKGEKGIIHTNNYKITQDIINNIDDDRLIYINDDKMNNEDLLNEHYKSNKDTVIISPSLYAGADLKDDLSRFQIIVKLPFLSLGDRRVNKKSQVNQQWYVIEMLRTFIQMCGRSTRHKEDYCVTYVLDSSFAYYITNNAKFFTKSFLKRVILDKNKFDLNKFKQYIKGE